MIRTMILGPKEIPLIKSYNYEDTVIVINKDTGATELIPAKETSPYDHLLVTNGKAREVFMAITTNEEMAQEDIIKIINRMPV